jgi:carboxymethylenebutenolidase
MAGKEISIAGKDGTFMGYLATPTGGSGPGVVIIQEIFGINGWLRSVTDWLAGQGYMALAPDLFWKLDPGIQLDPTKEDEFNKGLELFGKFEADKGVEDIQATISTLRKMPGCTGKVGNLGFCLGGMLSYLTAARTDTEASSSYYGVGIENLLGEADKIKTPTILHIAREDGFVSREAQAKVEEGLKDHEHITIYAYEGANHGFCRETDEAHYKEDAAKLAHERTLDLFKNALV